MTRSVYREWIPSRDPRLRRHILHDSESRRYEFDTTGLTIQSVRHERHIAVLDQGNVGSCTGNAGVGCLGTDPYFETIAYRPVADARYPFDEDGALRLYSDAETIDGDGPYPPNDNGSTGLSIGKALQAAGEISGYQWTFSLDAALRALSVTSFITGINWYQQMFDPSPEGVVTLGGTLVGGHEIVVDEYDATRGLVGFTNSWGTSWGVAGRFFMAAEDFGRLLDRQGDVTIFTPLTAPAPAPIPPPAPADADAAFAAVLHDWAYHRHIGANARAASAARMWLHATGL